jgi:Raf kinase inhibitor-like YbhB/YbcL family protein
MLEKIPSGVGRALRRMRAGYDKLVSEADDFVSVPDVIALESPAFDDGGSIPPRYTADGEKISPPLAWSGPIGDAAGLVLIVEDPDAPSLDPLVHLIAWDLPPALGGLPEGEFKSPGHAGLDEMLGRNAYFQAAWLPPDPPAGHGPHLYVFQLFALDRKLDFTRPPGRKSVVDAMRGRVTAKGVLTGTYERT